MDKVITSEMWFVFTLLFIVYLGVVLIILLVLNVKDKRCSKSDKKKESPDIDADTYIVCDNEFKNTTLFTNHYYINLKKGELARCDDYTRYSINDYLDFAKVVIEFNLDTDGDFVYIESDQNGRIKKIYNW